MKALILTPWYPDAKTPNHGIFVRDQALAIQTLHEVVLISSKVDYSQFGFLSSTIIHSVFQGINEYRIVVKKSFPVFNQINYFILTIWNTYRIARAFKPDIIHGNIGYPGAFWSWATSRLLRRPYLITEHTRLVNNFRSAVHKFFTIYFLKKAITVITVSTRCAAEISSIIKIKSVVIPNIIDFGKFVRVSPLPDGLAYNIGFLGRLDTNNKGLDILLKSLAEFNRPFVLHIGGAGKLSTELKDLANRLGIADRCIFYGFIEHYDVPSFMDRLHFFVSASRFESFGMVIAEAMACGLPVIATKCGGPEDFVNADNGILVEIDNKDAMLGALNRMVDDYPLFNRNRIRQNIIDEFSSQAFLNKITPLYQSLIAIQ